MRATGLPLPLRGPFCCCPSASRVAPATTTSAWLLAARSASSWTDGDFCRGCRRIWTDGRPSPASQLLQATCTVDLEDWQLAVGLGYPAPSSGGRVWPSMEQEHWHDVGEEWGEEEWDAEWDAEWQEWDAECDAEWQEEGESEEWADATASWEEAGGGYAGDGDGWQAQGGPAEAVADGWGPGQWVEDRWGSWAWVVDYTVSDASPAMPAAGAPAPEVAAVAASAATAAVRAVFTAGAAPAAPDLKGGGAAAPDVSESIPPHP